MEAVVLTWRELVIIVAAVLGIYVVELALLLRWIKAPTPKLWKRATPPNSELQRFNRLSAEIIDLREQVSRLQSELDKVRAVAAANASPYNQAIQMARQGLSAAEVAAGCGISRGEAELIVALYRKLRI